MKQRNSNVSNSSSSKQQVKDKKATTSQTLDSCHETTANVQEATKKDTNVVDSSSTSNKQGMRSRSEDTASDRDLAQQQQQQQHQDMTMTARNTSEIQKNRLVFGLNSRANKTKHDQYAEKRSGQESTTTIQSSFASAQQQQQSQPVEPIQIKSTATSQSSLPAIKNSASSPSKLEPTSQPCPTTTTTTTSSSGTTARASKYGNFHKPQVS